MNYSNLAFALDPNVKAVSVRFFNDHSTELGKKTYTYKTTEVLKKGDLCVVFVSGRPNVVKVEEYDIDVLDDSHEFKWIVSKVDTSMYELILEAEKRMISEVRAASNKAKRKQILDALGISDLDIPTLAVSKPTFTADTAKDVNETIAENGVRFPAR